MKKIFALIIAVVMIFSVVAIPASATVADSAQVVVDNVNAGDYFTAIESAFALAKELINEIHQLVGSIMAVVEKECAFCGVLHVA